MSAAKKQEDWNIEELIKVLHSFPLLDGFPVNLVKDLAEASEVLVIPPNTMILQQGQINEHLYFLVDGLVGVYVDGARVSKMQRVGDLLGEMSVISKKPVTASILSETPVTLVRLDSKFFLELHGPDRDLYLSILYRIYATVLADKLSTTNQKAKQFEELTIQLTATQKELEEANAGLELKVEERPAQLEEQNGALVASVRKMEELMTNKKSLFQKLSEFHSNNLHPLKSLLDEARKRLPDEAVISDARRVVFDVQQLLGPIISQYSSEQAIQSKRVLLADSNKKQQLVAKMTLGGSGVVLDIVSTVEEGKAKLETGQYDLVFVDTQMLELGNLVSEKLPSASLVLMTSENLLSYLPALKGLSTIPNIVSRDEGDRLFTVKNILTTVNKLLGRDLFGLEKYLSWGVDVQSRPLVGSRTRAEIIADVSSYFEKVGIRRVNRDRIAIVLEEMLMNAVYDAPTDKSGQALYNHYTRTQEVILKPEEQGQVRFATDGMLIAVSVVDPFGSLKGSTLLRYLEHNYGGASDDINAKENKGGAGRGLHQIVENSDLVVFNVEPGKKTEAIALFNVEVRETERLTPTFHWFVGSKS
jgi:CRP-like cAMP-binding protein/CheY-like chemotaxis protein